MSLLYLHLSSATTAVHPIKYVFQVSYLFNHDFSFAALSYFFHLIFQTTNLGFFHNTFFFSVNKLCSLFGKYCFQIQEDFSLLKLNLSNSLYYFSPLCWLLSLQAALFLCRFVPFVLTDHCLFGCPASLCVVIFSLSAPEDLVLVLASNDLGRHASRLPIRSPWVQASSRAISLQSSFQASSKRLVPRHLGQLLEK